MNRRLDLSVIVPCYHEELNVPELTERVLRTFERGKLAAELVLVEDGSTDGTAKVIRAQTDMYGDRVVGVFHRHNRGLAAAWQSGVEAASGTNVVVIDADLQYQPEDILRLYRALMESSVDIVQGWRSSIGRLRDGRYVLSRGLNAILNAGFSMRLRDNKSGFVCCAKEVMLDLLTYRGRYAYWQSFLMVAAHAKGYSYREIETLFEERKQGQSFLDDKVYRATLLNLVDVGKAFWEYRLFAEPHDVSRHFLKQQKVELEEPPARRADPLRWRAYMTVFDRTRSLANSRFEHYYETLSATQWLSAEQVRQLQDEKVRRLVRHAYRSVPYYRLRMQELGLHPEDVRSQADLRKLPLLSRQDVRRHLHFDMMQEGVSHRELLRLTTSGRHGEPLVCYAGRSQVDFRRAIMLRAREWAGYRFGDSWVRLVRETHEDQTKKRLRKRLDAQLTNCTEVPAFGWRQGTLSRVQDSIAKAAPKLIEGDTEVLTLLARHSLNQGALTFTPKAIIATGQTLSRETRELIEQAFKCSVFNRYQSSLFACISAESDDHQGHHVAAEGHVVELLVADRPAEPGETGEIVITDLNNYCMPLIRYRTGDMATALCSTALEAGGRGLPRIGSVQGREPALISGTEGQLVPGAFFSRVFNEYDYAVRRYQVIQREPGEILLKLVKAPRYSESRLQEVTALIRQQLGQASRIEVEFDAQPT